MRDYNEELNERVAFIRAVLQDAHAQGIVYGNSGGKDSALCGILCKKACDNTVGVILPCSSTRNFGSDREDGLAVAAQFQIETRLLDLSPVKDALLAAAKGVTDVSESADKNIAPRLHMTALYTIAASENRIVAGTGNRSEGYLGYFTKWGDGAHDFNPIADLTVREVYEFLRFLNAPESILTKAPSAGLFEGQTDEDELGIRYDTVDEYLLTGSASESDRAKIEAMHRASEHKRGLPTTYHARS